MSKLTFNYYRNRHRHRKLTIQLINKNSFFLIFAILLINLLGCNKYLDKNPDQGYAIPKKLEDFQLLLDNYVDINAGNYPNAAELLSDNFYLKSATWESQDEVIRNIYLWGKESQTLRFWFQAYRPILTCNIILEEFEKNSSLKSSVQGKEIWARAMFIKSYYYLAITQLFTPPYNPDIANETNGIVLRTKSDFNIPSTRATLQATYDSILNGFKEAANFLPDLTSIKSRPNKCAAFGALARTYLWMNKFDSAGFYANRSLQIYDSLMDYNSLPSTGFVPLTRFNKEVVFQMRGQLYGPLSFPTAAIDSNLVIMYSDNDLRKQIFFFSYQGASYFKGDYDGNGLFGSGYVFSGIVTDEMYLIYAECLARNGDIINAMKILNKLLISRWNVNFEYTEVTATDEVDAVRKIIAERRKELLFRGERWSDLRRLNSDPNYSISPKRLINNQEYVLTPGSPRYALLIPVEVINQAGISQNP